MSKVPPKELISLVSHVELNKEGWWGKAVQQLVLAGLWISGGILSLEGVKDCVTGEFHASLSTQDVSQHVGQLLRRGDVVQLVDGRFKISEQAKRILEAELKTAEDITNATRDQFISLLNWSNEEALDAWNRLEQELLLPWIKDLGANTYNLISGDRVRMGSSRKSWNLKVAASSPRLI